MLKRFEKQFGKYIEKIYGQKRLGFAMTENEDMFDLVEFAEHGGYKGSNIIFFDFENGRVYTPFELKRDVIYGDPVYVGGFYYFLRADYGEKKVTLFRYLPGRVPEPVTELSTDEVKLYNLQIMGEDLHIVSEDSEFYCYWPEKFSYKLEPHETVCFMADGKIYSESWVEEDWDNERDCAGPNYKFYETVLVRDAAGNLLSKEVGSLTKDENGEWWIG